MGSVLVPILLIVVLLVGVGVFLVMSNRQNLTGSEAPRSEKRQRGSRRAGSRGRRRRRPGWGGAPDNGGPAPPPSERPLPERPLPYPGPGDAGGPGGLGDPAGLGGPGGPGSPPSTPRHDAVTDTDTTTAWGGDEVTARNATGGSSQPEQPRRNRSTADPEATSWTEPPNEPPPMPAPPPPVIPSPAVPTARPGGQGGPGGPIGPGGSAPGSDPDDATTTIVRTPAAGGQGAGGGVAGGGIGGGGVGGGVGAPPGRPSGSAASWDTTTEPVDPPPPSAVDDIVADEPDFTTAPGLRLAAAGRTRRGKRGGPNEDAFVVADGLLAVADGVGGEAAGQIASTLAVTTVAGFRPQYASDPRDGLRRAVDRANRVVRDKPKEQPSWRGMACTLDVVVLGRQRETADMLTVAHVGDSCVWLQPSKGRPRRLTTPHAIKNGPLLNAVGLSDDIEADLISEPVQAGDRVVLASDGITKVMTPEQLDGLMSELGNEPPERAADALVEAAMLAGARDDTTIVVADLVPDNTAR